MRIRYVENVVIDVVDDGVLVTGGNRADLGFAGFEAAPKLASQLPARPRYKQSHSSYPFPTTILPSATLSRWLPYSLLA